MAPAPGDFQLVPTGGAGGWLIRAGQWANGDGFADFEHVRLYIGNGEFVEAEPGGARKVGAPMTGGMWSSGIIPLTDGQRNMITGWAVHYIGTGYSFLDYTALAAHRLGIPGPGLRDYIATSGHMICSQLVDACYAKSGVHLFTDDRWPGYVTPGSLYGLLKGKQ